jgi:hypothetical protein
MENNLFDTRVEITTVTLHYLLHDLVDCLTTSPHKIAKRLARLRLLCILMGIDPDAYIRHLVIPKEVNVHATDAEITKFIWEKQGCEEYYGYAPIVYEKDRQINDTVKKLIEAELTSGLNADGVLYKLTCRNISAPLCKRLSKHSVFGPLMKAGDLQIVHKGGVAYYHLLCDEFPDRLEEIRRVFGYGGDNDISCMLNPNLEGYDDLHKLLVDYVWHYLVDKSSRFGEGSAINKRAKKLKTIKVGGVTMSVQPAERRSFQIRANGNVSLQENLVSKHPVPVSRNDLDFPDEIGRPCTFTLVRAKKALFVTPIHSDDFGALYDIEGQVFGSELIDLAIPHRKEDKYRLTFHYYKSGQWTRKAMI